MVLKFERHKIATLSSELLTSVEQLREYSSLSRDEFIGDRTKLNSAKYLLIVSIEAAVDMCNHVIAEID